MKAALLTPVAAWAVLWALSAGSAPPSAIHAYSWSPVPPECRHITPFVWIRNDSDPAAVAREALALPPGRRALFSWDLHRGLLTDTNDRCRGADGRLTPHMGIWPEHGTEAVRARFDNFFRRFREAGGVADLLILDFEGGYSNWHIGGLKSRDRWLAIQGDPRFAALERRLGFGDLLSVAEFSRGTNYQTWNAVVAGLLDASLNRAVFAPARAWFPAIRCSNYGSVIVTGENAGPDLNGHREWRLGGPVGTHVSRSFYGSIGQLAARKLDGVQPLGQSPFAGLLYSVNRLRDMARSSTLPMHPWLAWQRYAGDGPGKPVAAIGGSPYYRELAIHLALHGATEFLFWNPHPAPTARDPAPLSQPEDEILLDGILDDLNRRLGPGPRKPLTLQPVAWNARVVASGLRVGDRVTWRFTFAPGAEPCEAMLDGKPVRLEPAAGEVGAWFTHAASQQLVLR